MSQFTVDQYREAAKKALAAGDTAAAQRLIAAGRELEQSRPAPQRNPDGTYGQPPEGFVQNTMTGQMEDIRSPNNPNIPTGRGTALAAGLAQGVTFGASDEGTAAIGTMMNPGSNYDYELARAREINRRGAEDQPLAYYGGLIPGAAASSYMGARGLGVNLTGPTLLNTAGRSAGAGAVEGALYGFNTGEGGVENRLGSAAREGAMGAGIGGAAPYAVAGLRSVGNFGRDLIGGGVDTAIGRASQGRANRALINTLQKSGRSLDDVADDVARAAQEGQPEFRTMDAMGRAGRNRVNGIVRSGGDGAEEIAQFLDQRQLDQRDRVLGFMDDAFETRGTTAARTQAELDTARRATNTTNYNAARQAAGPVNLNGAIEKIDALTGRNPLIGDTGLEKTEIGSRLAKLRGQMAGSNSQLIDFNEVLNIKEDLGTVIGRIQKSGDAVPFELAQVYGALDDALEAASDGYRVANDTAREGRKVVAAVDQGAQMAGRGRLDDSADILGGMTPEQRSAARVGFADPIASKIENSTAVTANQAKEFASTKRAALSQELATDPRLFADRIARENDMWLTQDVALRGSRTADNMQAIDDLGPRAEIARALLSAPTQGVAGTVASVANAAGRPVANALTGMNEPTRKLIADALMSSDPRAALASAMRQESLSQGQRRVFEALTRAIGREVTP